jgi:hypothetical protein
VVEEGYTRVEGLGGGEQAMCEGRGAWLLAKNRAAGGQFWLTKCRGCSILIGWLWIARCTLCLWGGDVGNKRRVGGGLGELKNRDSSYYDSIFSWIGTAEASCEVTGGPAVVI